jgi:DNA-binding NarL/FixJ family response regulator
MTDYLTERERQAAVLASHGFSNQQIAATMKLQDSTVRQYMHRVYEKTGADRQTLSVCELAPSFKAESRK